MRIELKVDDKEKQELLKALYNLMNEGNPAVMKQLDETNVTITAPMSFLGLTDKMEISFSLKELLKIEIEGNQSLEDYIRSMIGKSLFPYPAEIGEMSWLIWVK